MLKVLGIDFQAISQEYGWGL